MKLVRRLVSVGLLSLAAGCAHRQYNAPLAHYQPGDGYRFNRLSSPGNSDDLLVLLAFSGGGTRAAALSYGVLEKLAATEIHWGGRRHRLLDEVDVISAVSGGSFTAAYYALNGDLTFTNYPREFLHQNNQTHFEWSFLAPRNCCRLVSEEFDRIDLAAEYYDQHLFHHATFGDLTRRGRGPYLMHNATDMSSGARFEFTQNQFDLLCSDIGSFPIARAVAASSAFPVLLSPLTLRNYAGSCDCVAPEWVNDALHSSETSMRRAFKAREIENYADGHNKRFIHLLDGGLADYLGLRGLLDLAASGDAPWSEQPHLNLERVRKVVLIVVNAGVDNDRGWDLLARSPNSARVGLAAVSVPINRYAVETIDLMKQSFETWLAELRARRNPPLVAGLPGLVGGAADAGGPEFYYIEAGFDALTDARERAYFKHIPTSFQLSAAEVDKLRAVAGRLLDQSPGFQKLLRALK